MNGFLGKQQVQATIFWPSVIDINLSPFPPSRNTDVKGKRKRSQNLHVSEVKLKKKALKKPQKALRLAF